MTMGIPVAPRQPYVMFGAFPTPGVATVRGLTSPRKWDSPQGYGTDGAVGRCVGTALAEFEIELRLWDDTPTSTQWIQWETFALTVLAKPINGAPVGGAWDIGHPQINGPPWNVRSVVVTDATGWVQSATGLWTVVIKVKEWKPPRPMLARPIATIPEVVVPVPTAQDAGEIAIAKARAIAKGLGG